MNEDLKILGQVELFSKNEPLVSRFAQNSPLETQGIAPETGFVRIVHRNPTVFDAKSKDEPNVAATGKFRQSPKMWVKNEVGDPPCWAIVDIGASTSLISRHMASVVKKLVNTNPHRLLGPIGKVMAIVGKMIT